jgi:hypothetical protein
MRYEGNEKGFVAQSCDLCPFFSYTNFFIRLKLAFNNEFYSAGSSLPRRGGAAAVLI